MISLTVMTQQVMLQRFFIGPEIKKHAEKINTEHRICSNLINKCTLMRNKIHNIKKDRLTKSDRLGMLALMSNLIKK